MFSDPARWLRKYLTLRNVVEPRGSATRQRLLTGPETLEDRWVPAAFEFAPPMTFTVATTTSGIAAGDFDADGRQDLVVLDPNRNLVSIFLGHGDGSFALKAEYGSGIPASV